LPDVIGKLILARWRELAQGVDGLIHGDGRDRSPLHDGSKCLYNRFMFWETRLRAAPLVYICQPE
jgi:hypothetical protein